jgi:uncharacterized protein (TIGR02145 family)
MKCKLTVSLLILVASQTFAQNYLISFAGTGASSNVESVIVENISQGTSVVLKSGDQLKLTDSTMGVDEIGQKSNPCKALNIYPNPTAENANIEFETTKADKVSLSIYDTSGKQIAYHQSFLNKGLHHIKVSGFGRGIYSIQVKTGINIYNGKIVSHCLQNEKIQISYNGSENQSVNTAKLKNASFIIEMNYKNGDWLKYTGTSGNFSSVIADLPTQSKTITFDFIECTDADGNNYPVVKIGTQIWMGANLKTTKFRSGVVMTNGASNPYLNGPIYWAYNNDETNVEKYGRLYTWWAVQDYRQICPPGWHVSTEEDWKTLETFLVNNGYGGSERCNTIGLSLFDIDSCTVLNVGRPGVTKFNHTGNKYTGFSAFLGGVRDVTDGFYGLGERGFWWTSNTKVIYDFNCGNNSFNCLGPQYWNMGCSVRCVKD